VLQSSRVSACRRALNSHNAASREHRAALEESVMQLAQQAAVDKSHANDWQPPCHTAAPHCVVPFSIQSVRRATATSRCADTKLARRWLENVSTHGPQRGAGSNWSTPKTVARSPYPVCRASHGASRPNPSLKLSPNGVPPGPRGRAVYHRPRGPGVTPSAPT
jgi:hypothetical protein